VITHRRLSGILAVALGLLVVVDAVALLRHHPWAVDLVIPLRAAERWATGGQPYLPESFLAGPGYDLPFLYPPAILPAVETLRAIPFAFVLVAWYMLAVGTAAWTCRRLDVPWIVVPFMLLWPPFFEALLGANVQIFLFGAFVALLYARPDHSQPWRPIERDPGVRDRPAPLDGLLASANGLVKIGQLQPWVYLLRRRPDAALFGAGVVVVVLIATLPLTGIHLWSDWLLQLGRAADPTWGLVGSSFLQYLPGPVSALIVAGTVGLAFFVPPRHAPAWLGILMVVGNPSLRIFGLLFLLPGMLLIRRELALLAAIFVATYSPQGMWLASAIVIAGMVDVRRRSIDQVTALAGSTSG
jgi:hypothetical protein